MRSLPRHRGFRAIPSYQVYKGTDFHQVDQAVNFVLSKVALSVGTRADAARAPVRYEIPKEVGIGACPERTESGGSRLGWVGHGASTFFRAVFAG